MPLGEKDWRRAFPQLGNDDAEFVERLDRDLRVGLDQGILPAYEVAKLASHVLWAAHSSPSEWRKLREFHHAHSAAEKAFQQAMGGIFQGQKAKLDRLPLVRASFFKVLAMANGKSQATWKYETATAWKESLLRDDPFSGQGYLAGKDLKEIFRRGHLWIAREQRYDEKQRRGDLGTVTLFTWKGHGRWVFKPEDQTCAAPQGKESGIPAEGARMHERSLAFYVLARILRLSGIVVKTYPAFFETARGRATNGIVMSFARGLQPKIDLPSVSQLREYMQMSREERAQVFGAKEMYETVLRPHRRRGLSAKLFETIEVASDLYRATWLDYLAAQMDRHASNFFVHVDEIGRYRKILLIDNDMAFGTVVDPVELKGIQGSKNRGLPEHVPVGLGEAIAALSRAVPNAGSFWDEAKKGPPRVDPKTHPLDVYSRSELPPPEERGPIDRDWKDDLSLVARCLARTEFEALFDRVRKAARHAQGAKVLRDADVARMAEALTKADPHDQSRMANESYWHELYWIYTNPQFELEYGNPMSHEQFLQEDAVPDPVWKEDAGPKACQECQRPFNDLRLRERCTRCGRTLCTRCAPKQAAVFGKPVRVCDRCKG